MDVKKLLLEYTQGELRGVFEGCPKDILKDATQIHIRQGLPLYIESDKGSFFATPQGKGTKEHARGYKATLKDITGVLDRISKYSLYAFDAEIKNGFITIPGGHRVGIAGRATLDVDGKIKTLRNISFISIRISREMIGAASKIMPIIKEGEGLYNTLILSPPGKGKTTILRDAIRQLSISGYNVSVVDERSEIGGSYNGVVQNDLGPCTDLLDGATKAEGMRAMLRAMSPDVMAVDEIGHRADADALLEMACCGVNILATAHGKSVIDLYRKPALTSVLEAKIFDRFIFLEGTGKVGKVYDAELKEVVFK
ncbi:MAG: Flp pilus assembly complex ATPase component TadA [Defluviitaleaceae bacterium]|nr:Flp pilus assembly complex ATPase component TadA [Defluviitaleaceae bacterium]